MLISGLPATLPRTPSKTARHLHTPKAAVAPSSKRLLHSLASFQRPIRFQSVDLSSFITPVCPCCDDETIHPCKLSAVISFLSEPHVSPSLARIARSAFDDVDVEGARLRQVYPVCGPGRYARAKRRHRAELGINIP